MTEKRFTKVCLSLLMGSLSFPAMGARVDSSDAHQLASEFFESRSGRSASLELCAVGGSQANPLYYVFNDAAGGFVIISADDTTSPVVGYSLTNSYLPEQVPSSMSWVLQGLGKEIEVASKTQQSLSPAERSRRAVNRSAGQSKLLSTPSWSQEGPFNMMIPGQPLVGCVGTAMASIMKYYNFPAAGQGDKGGVSFDVTYDWDNMRTDNYRSSYSPAEAEAVATLMWHAAKSIDTQFGMSGSSAYEVRVPGALSTYFGYDPGVSYKKRSEVSTQQAWDQIVKNEIDNGRPVLYCGQDVSAGHAFVCDGYDGNGMFHFNWGWGGAANGYFSTSMLNPTVSRTHNYNNLNTIIYNIKPGSGAAVWSPIRITADANQIGLGSDMANLASGQTFKVRVGNLKNVGFSDFSGKIAVALFGADGSFKSTLSTPQNFNMQSLGYLFDSYKDFSGCKLPAGVLVEAGDVVRLATQTTGSFDWLPVAGELPTTNELDANRAAPVYLAVNLPTVTGATVTGDNKVIPGWNYTLTVVPANPARDVVTVKANGFVIQPSGNNYTVANVCTPQEISISISDVADVKERRSVWVETPGTLSEVLSGDDASLVKDLTIFGRVDARDFEYIRQAIPLTRLDISSASIAANGSNQANAIPREAFRGMSKLQEVVLPGSVNRLNNGCFRQSGIRSIVIPAGVATYEYNIFVGCTALRDIWVGRENPEFINWCVLSGVKTALCTLHVPSESAKTKYAAKENWKDIANIVVEKAPAQTDVAFAVMDNNEVKYDSDIEAGRFEKGKQVSFKASHIADNDNKMTVYANSTLLSPDANGVYNVTLNGNTIVHFNIETPLAVTDYPSQWTLNGKNGSVGLFTDAVNVIPGQEFVIRANSFKVPAGLEQLFWAAALTDANGNIKEFISPVTVFTGKALDNQKMNINCCVKESTVREGNYIRLVTSVNKKTWSVVKADGEGIVDAIPAINNVTPVYNLNLPALDNATISGVPATAVRGRDLTLNITPVKTGDHVDLTVNGKKLFTGVTKVSYPFVAMEDMDFDINVYTPQSMQEVTYEVTPGTLYQMVTAQSVRPHVIVKGQTDAGDLALALRQDFAAKTIKKLDLSQLKITDNYNTAGDDSNTIPSALLYNTTAVGAVMPVVEEIILPESVTTIQTGAFKNCSKIREITLPSSLSSCPEIGFFASGSKKYTYRLGILAFEGCTSLQTIYIPGAPDSYEGKTVIAHFNPQQNGGNYMYNLGLSDPSKVTVVVPQEYLNAYLTTPVNDGTSYNPLGNCWRGQGYNIVGEYPVYSLNYDLDRIVLTDDKFDNQKAANFLGDNVKVESLTVAGKIRLADPVMSCKVFDNGVEVAVAEDGTIPVTFYNPAKRPELAGDHTISVVPLYNVDLHKTSDLFSVIDLKAETSGDDYSSLEGESLKNVTPGATVSFRLDFAAEHDNELSPRVKNGEEIVEPDGSGLYTVTMDNAHMRLEIYAVPDNGAVLNADELASVAPEEAASITSLGISGEIDEETLRQTINTFSNLNHIDLSTMENDVPEGIFSGMADLEGVVLPAVAEIKPNTFNGCSSLSEITIPESVASIGEGAFRGCSSLQTLTLSGVESIGSNAFDGCDGLTSITLQAASGDAPASAKGRAPRRSAGFHQNAFAGLNPNCMIYVEENVAMPSASNCISVTHGIITETQPDGSSLEREGRIYTANSDLSFSAGSSLALENKINVPAGAKASVNVALSADAINPLVIPFDVTSITEAGKEVALGKYPVKKDNIAVYTLEAGSDDFLNVAQIKANVPYLAEPYAAGEFTFSAEGPFEIGSTGSEIVVKGQTFDLKAVYSETALDPGVAYELNQSARCFDLIGSRMNDIDALEDEVAPTAAPFSVYATSDSGHPSIDLNIDNMPTEIIEAVINDSISISREGAMLVIFAAEPRTLTLFTLDGKAAARFALSEGRNVVSAPEAGIYLLDGVKVRF